jgi:hypothetical protein
MFVFMTPDYNDPARVWEAAVAAMYRLFREEDIRVYKAVLEEEHAKAMGLPLPDPDDLPDDPASHWAVYTPPSPTETPRSPRHSENITIL